MPRVTARLSTQELLSLTPARARSIAHQDEAFIVWVLLELSTLAREAHPGAAEASPAGGGIPDLSTPSGMIAPYQKPTGKTRKAKPGRKPGHEGARRPAPLAIDRHETHTLRCCPDCGGPVSPPSPTPRRRIVEDIEVSRPVVTEHAIRSHWCPRCSKRVEPVVTEALPRSTIGNRTVALTSWLHYGLGATVSQVAAVLDNVFHFPVSEGGLAQMWRRLADSLLPWYEEIAEQAKDSAVLHADETGWRVNGQTHWLWCFTRPDLTYYLIDESRGSKVLLEFFGETFGGTLVSDFLGAYNCVLARRRQVCLTHLLREVKKVSLQDASDEWVVFAESLKRLLRDALRLARRADREAPDFADKRARIHRRLDALCDGLYLNPNAARIVKRLVTYRQASFSFLDDADIPPDNNRAEREIRPAVIARKNSYHNMSDAGARAQAILMSVYRTLKLRGHDPVETLSDALAVAIAGGRLPALPKAPDHAARPSAAAGAHTLPHPRDG